MPYNSVMKFLKRQLLILLFSLLMAGLFAAPSAPAVPATGASAPAAGNPPPHGPGPGTPPPQHPRPLPPSPKDPDNMLYYRGNRTAQEDLPLTVNQVKVSRVGVDQVDVEIVFNQSINPRSVKTHRITIDGSELPQNVSIWFNKKGDTVKFMLASEKDSLELGIKGIRAFNGTVMSPTLITVQVEAAAGEDSAE